VQLTLGIICVVNNSTIYSVFGTIWEEFLDQFWDTFWPMFEHAMDWVLLSIFNSEVMTPRDPSQKKWSESIGLIWNQFRCFVVLFFDGGLIAWSSLWFNCDPCVLIWSIANSSSIVPLIQLDSWNFQLGNLQCFKQIPKPDLFTNQGQTIVWNEQPSLQRCGSNFLFCASTIVNMQLHNLQI
jgi:hypothetical protein